LVPLVPNVASPRLGTGRIDRAGYHERSAGGRRLEVDVNLRPGDACPAGDERALVPLRGYLEPLFGTAAHDLR
jgi:hypothetical protein